MSNRINTLQLEPDAFKAMLALDGYSAKNGLSKTHWELIKIRASQINGCAYCIDMHTKEARKFGETEQRIYALNAWHDTPFFTDEEKAILKLTEEVTLITGRVSDQTYQEAARLLDEHYLAKVIMAIVTINAWNRISITSQTQPAK